MLGGMPTLKKPAHGSERFRVTDADFDSKVKAWMDKMRGDSAAEGKTFEIIQFEVIKVGGTEAYREYFWRSEAAPPKPVTLGRGSTVGVVRTRTRR